MDQVKLHLCWKQYTRKIVCSNTHRYFKVIISNFGVQRVIRNHSQNHTAFVEAFNKELAKQLLKSMDDQEIQGPDKVSKPWIKNLSSVVNKTKNTKASMIYVKPKDAIKLGIVKLNKSETDPNEKMLPEHDQ